MRFPEFAEEWKEKTLGDTCEIQMCKRVLASQTTEKGDVPFYKIGTIGNIPDAYISRELYDIYRKKYNYPTEGELLITCAGTVGKCVMFNGNDAYFQDSNIVWISNPTHQISNDFLYHYISQVDWSKLNSTTIIRIYNDNLRDLRILTPTPDEQAKIATFLSLLDDRISTQSQIIEDLKSLKKSLRNNLYERIAKAGKSERIANLLDYEQPSNYIVTSTNYSNDSSLTPVLTANKAFILGYTNETFGIYDKGECLVFDDFTMDLKYVDFPFKVKSSAIKILTPKRGVNLRFIYEYLSFLKLTSTDHKRHYISEIEPMYISVPETETQNRISNTLLVLDKKIDLEETLCNLFVTQKKYLLANMFI